MTDAEHNAEDKNWLAIPTWAAIVGGCTVTGVVLYGILKEPEVVVVEKVVEKAVEKVEENNSNDLGDLLTMKLIDLGVGLLLSGCDCKCHD